MGFVKQDRLGKEQEAQDELRKNELLEAALSGQTTRDQALEHLFDYLGRRR